MSSQQAELFNIPASNFTQLQLIDAKVSYQFILYSLLPLPFYAGKRQTSTRYFGRKEEKNFVEIVYFNMA